MLIPTDQGLSINRQAIRELHPNQDGVVVAVLSDGSQHKLLWSEAILQAMEGTVLPANDGFLKLIFRFRANQLERHPVIGWRVIGVAQPEPITPQQDGVSDPECYEGIRYPDGKVACGRDALFDSVDDFLTEARQQRVEWLKDNDPR